MNEPTKQKNNAKRLLTLLCIMQDNIDDENLIGIAMWSKEAFYCMLHIELDNGLHLL